MSRHLDALIIISAVVLRICLTARMGVGCSLHDTGSYDGLGTAGFGAGHLGYVEYLFEYHALPDFDPTTVMSFYNPPFYYIVSALVMGLLWSCGLPANIVGKAPTIVTCVAMCACVVVFWKLLRELEVSDRVRHVLLALAAFYPAGIWLSFTATNDALCILLCLLAVLLVVMWRRRADDEGADGQPRLWRRSSWLVVGAGLSFGLACATKLSAAMLAPAIAVVFLLRIWELRAGGRWKALVAPYACFLLVAVPLALAFPLYNLKTYDIPISYVQDYADDPVFGDEVTLADRIGLPSVSQLSSSHFDSKDISAEQNIWPQTLKSSLFDEYYVTGQGLSGPLMQVLTWVSVALGIVLAVLACVGLFARHVMPPWQRLLIGLGAAFVFVSYLRFCFLFPHAYTQSFRYIVVAWLLMLAAAAKGLDHVMSPATSASAGHLSASVTSRKVARPLMAVLTCLVVVTVILSAALYVFWVV
ncbi:MAG: phospholipid carrier-dependent glycosyltransferase [Atopobiaceae bacterium]|nr:phospholipid carrier-dependent glycosyltransferase [Atopobiaceae bacterium]